MIIAQEHEIKLEQEILGTIFKNTTLYRESKTDIRPNMFSLSIHQNIYKALGKYLQENKNLILTSFINDNKANIKELGGDDYIRKVSSCNPTTVGFKNRLKSLINNYNDRNLYELGETIKSQEVPTEDKIKSVEKALENIYSTEIGKEIDINSPFESYLNDLYSTKDTGMESGFKALDNTLGKFQTKRLITLFARAGIGKSTVAIQIALNMILKKYKVIYGSGEMSTKEVINKMASSKLRIEYEKFASKKLGGKEKDEVFKFASALPATNFYVTNETDIDKFIKEVKLYKMKYGLDVVFVDYINKYTSGLGNMPLTEKIGIVSGKLKALALEEDICVVLLAQANRESDKKYGKHLTELIDENDIQDSARIEQDSDQVIALYRNKKFDDETYRKEVMQEAEQLKEQLSKGGADSVKIQPRIDYNSIKATLNPFIINFMVVKNRHGKRNTMAFKWDAKYSKVSEI